jgi:hypothetical protein
MPITYTLTSDKMLHLILMIWISLRPTHKYINGSASDKSFARRKVYFNLIKSSDSPEAIERIVKLLEKEETMFKIDFMRTFLHHFKLREFMEMIDGREDIDSGYYVDICEGIKHLHEFQEAFCKGAPISELRY